jgi:hypothetical protein
VLRRSASQRKIIAINVDSRLLAFIHNQQLWQLGLPSMSNDEWRAMRVEKIVDEARLCRPIHQAFDQFSTFLRRHTFNVRCMAP